MGIKEKYFSWAATEYRSKLSALTSDPPVEWSPSPPPAPSALSPALSGPSSRSPSAQGVRKPRGFGGPASSPLGESYRDEQTSQREANEDFFASMGAKNDSRSADLPPSQGLSFLSRLDLDSKLKVKRFCLNVGGKYSGFGSGGVQPDEQQQRRQANESFFAGLGSRNESRSADLPPSQGSFSFSHSHPMLMAKLNTSRSLRWSIPRVR